MEESPTEQEDQDCKYSAHSAHIGPFDSKEKNTASIQGNYLQADLPSIGYHASSTDLHNQNNGYKMDLDDIQIAASTEIQANLKREEEVQG